MTIIHPFDDFLFELFPKANKNDINILQQEIEAYYTSGNIKPTVTIDEQFITIEINTGLIEKQEKDFQRVIALCEKGKYAEAKPILKALIKANHTIIWDGAGVGEIIRGKKGFISSTTAKFVFNKKMNSKFFFHLRDSIEYTLKQIPTGMGIPHLNPQVLNNFPCPVPPKEEQTAITNYLDEKTQKIDAIVSNIGKQIETLKELRKTLINDVVTGKIKVTD